MESLVAFRSAKGREGVPIRGNVDGQHNEGMQTPISRHALACGLGRGIGNQPLVAGNIVGVGGGASFFRGAKDDFLLTMLSVFYKLYNTIRARGARWVGLIFRMVVVEVLGKFAACGCG
jgi:hypothetical protein